MTHIEFNVAMAQLGISRRDLAADTGISPDHITKMKHGKAPVSRLLQRYLELRLENERLWDRFSDHPDIGEPC